MGVCVISGKFKMDTVGSASLKVTAKLNYQVKNVYYQNITIQWWALSISVDLGQYGNWSMKVRARKITLIHNFWKWPLSPNVCHEAWEVASLESTAELK